MINSVCVEERKTWYLNPLFPEREKKEEMDREEKN
jgi:hypothetical protein